jgi:hypothetical protein
MEHYSHPGSGCIVNMQGKVVGTCIRSRLGGVHMVYIRMGWKASM